MTIVTRTKLTSQQYLLTATLVSLWAMLMSSISHSQEPDPNGWSDAPENNQLINTAFGNQLLPGQQTPSQPTTKSDGNLTANIRNQIGLATFEEPVTEDVSQVDQQASSSDGSLFSGMLTKQTDQLTSPEGLTSSIKVALLLATLSLAPAIILMTTCYVRVIVVLTLLKQAFGAQQLPPTQVLTALSLFVTLLIMTPVWNQVKTDAIDPYTQTENGISWDEAWERGIIPIKTFMANQIEAAGNGESVALFYKYLPDHSLTPPSSAKDVPINVLLPAFMVSELKVAFLLGFQIFLPFLVLDLVVSSVTVSTGMLMLPPTMVSFPLKLILFVLVDGWNLVVGMLLQSFSPFT